MTAYGQVHTVCRVFAYGLLVFMKHDLDASHTLCVQNFRPTTVGVLVPSHPAPAVSWSSLASKHLTTPHPLKPRDAASSRGAPRLHAEVQARGPSGLGASGGESFALSIRGCKSQHDGLSVASVFGRSFKYSKHLVKLQVEMPIKQARWTRRRRCV